LNGPDKASAAAGPVRRASHAGMIAPGVRRHARPGVILSLTERVARIGSRAGMDFAGNT